jgi:hypothetical protein
MIFIYVWYYIFLLLINIITLSYLNCACAIAILRDSYIVRCAIDINTVASAAAASQTHV